MSHQPVGGYKEEPGTGEPGNHPGHHHHQPQPSASAAAQQPQHSAHQQHHPHHQRPGLPHQQHSASQQQHPPPSSSSSYASSPHVPQQQQQHQSPFAPPSSLPHPQHPQHPQHHPHAHAHHHGQPPPPSQTQQDVPYFTHPSPYGTPSASSSSYPPQVAEAPDVMTTHAMNRPSYPPIYHTPQSNSPASVNSPTASEHRSVYSQQQMQAPIYGYPQAYPQMPSAPPQSYHPPPPQHMTSQPLLMSQTPGQTMTPPQHHTQQLPPNPPSAPPKLPQTPLHKASPPTSANKPTSGSSVNPNAAPGPIPATTPLVVRQDQNGVQWIMFEYSRDRVKMEYTIRCDVESVNVDALSHEFKTENCVYPRACCNKEQYRGNRLIYETECNTVGWALAELNPPLRGKRGLIQRAVDSWRNSNQDPRLRSRRVRRMAKLNSRKANAQAAQTHLSAGSPGVQALPSSSGVGLGLKAPGGLLPNTGAQLQHHHHQPSGDGAANGEEDMGAMLQHHHTAQPQFSGQMGSANNSRSSSGHLSPAVGNEEFGNGQQSHHHHPPSAGGNDMRPRHVFHGYPTSYPSENVSGPSMPPSMHDGMDQMNSSSNAPNAVTASTPPKTNTSLFGDIPDHKRRKFILVDDPHRGARVRVRVMLDQVHMQEIPDSYRKSNSVYPRSFMSSQDDPDSRGIETHTSITVPMLDGTNMTVAAPPPSNSKRRKELDLNELGYRMSWSQSRVFAGRTMFLQRALDAYRNKMRSSMMANGTDVVSSAPHLETRVGKRKWLERSRRSRGAGSSA